MKKLLLTMMTVCSLAAAGCWDEVDPQTPPEDPTNPTPGKICKKTGCSSHLCRDQDMASTCEWRESYACYAAAECKRQADGNCGFTQTQTLKDCLANAK